MLKKFLSLIIVMTIVLNITSIETKAANRYGFTYDTNYYNVTWSTVYDYTVVTGSGGVLGTCTYIVGLAREKKTNDFVLMMREVMTPNKSKVKLFDNYYGYGFSEYVSASTILPSLDDYRPQNTPSSSTINFSIGADATGPNVSASYSITKSDLDVTVSCNTPQRKYYVIYDYKPHLIAGSNSYLVNESIQLGAASFNQNASNIFFAMNYDARFGVATKASASPSSIYTGTVYKATKTKSYALSVTKN